MSSNDSLAGGRRELGVDTMQQGSELQDSPRGPPSVASTKRDDVNYHHSQPHMVPQGSIPIQGQVLVDPATGQHYIVPQATFFSPSVQPMYFQPPPAPVYYPYGQVHTQGYVMQSAPPQAQYSVPIAAYQQRPYGYRPGYAHSTASSEDVSRRDDDRRLEDPPPSSPSISMASQSGFFPASFVSPSTTSFAQQYRHHQNPQRSSPNSQPEDPESGRDGFRRDVTRSSAEFQRLSGEFRRQGSGEFGRSNDSFSRHGNGDSLRSSDGYFRGGNEDGPNFARNVDAARQTERTPRYGGPPPWWGRHREEQSESLTDAESPRHHPRSSPPGGTHSESELGRARPAPAKAVRMDIDFSKLGEDEAPKPKPTTSRSVRMDIDLSKLPDETKVTEKKAPSRAPATAFTVNFDSAEEELSLQDAARKSAQARRILGRRSGGGGSATSSGSQDSGHRASDLPQSQSTNKRYLLNKLLQGEGKSSEENPEGAEVEERKECDVSSEAGTYVVDMSTRVGPGPASQLMAAKIIEDSDSSSDSSSDSESDESPDPRQKTAAAPPPRSPTQKAAPAQPESTTTTTERSDLVREMAKLRNLAGMRPTTSPAESRGSYTSRPSGPYDNSRPGPATPPQLPRPCTARTSLSAQPSNRSSLAASRSGGGGGGGSSTSSNAPFRRGDGGRYSMRGQAPGVAPSSPQQSAKRPPFRAGAAPVRTFGVNPAQQKEQEMNAWLRRKDYNPMKAAAEARKAKELKARGEQFMSNRSVSFHVGPVMQKPIRRDGFGEITRNRSQESLAVEEAEHASQRVLAEYSRGVVQDISRLSQQSSRATGKQLSGLARAVDMLSQKCKKSIELIRSQNKGCLSVSVEDLLAAAAEPPRKGETLNEQLDRLSDAFDAVQRYLEQYSLDGHESPIPEFTDDASEIQSVASSFTTHSSLSRHDTASPQQSRVSGAARSRTSTTPISSAHEQE